MSKYLPVPGFEGLLSISTSGEVRREARDTPGGRLEVAHLQPVYRRGGAIVPFMVRGRRHQITVTKALREAQAVAYRTQLAADEIARLCS